MNGAVVVFVRYGALLPGDRYFRRCRRIRRGRYSPTMLFVATKQQQQTRR